MKTKTAFAFGLAFSLSLMLLISCKKEDKTEYDSYFYQSQDTTSTAYTLYIDGKEMGLLPFSRTKPICGSGLESSKALRLKLKEGKYEVVAKNASGAEISSGNIKFSKSKTSSSGGTGGQEMTVTDNCLIVKLFY